MYYPALPDFQPLPAHLQTAMEEVARHVHDTWAAGRLSEGWTWGPVQDYALKTHPSLIPYEELSESEKDYDRRTAAQTIRCLLELGYRIEKE